jgi:hypothetical protein
LIKLSWEHSNVGAFEAASFLTGEKLEPKKEEIDEAM